MNLKELAESRVVIDNDICSGKARIRGTRVLVSDILLALAEGLSDIDILRNFRSLQTQDIKAAVAYAFCLSDNIKLRIGSSFEGEREIGEGKFVAKEDIDRQSNDMFTRMLEEQASIQAEITKEKVAQIKSKKSQKAKAPTLETKVPPKERPYDLLIDISQEGSTKIFRDEDHLEQGLELDFDNYVFELRKDAKPWLTYSVKEGVEIDQAMKRNLLVTYKDSKGKTKEAVFEGYLTSDRQHKVFIQKDQDANTCGRAL